MPEANTVADAMTASTGIQIVVINALGAIALGVGVAFLLKLIFARLPRSRIVVDLLPWRTAVVLAMLWATPISWLGSREEPMRTFVRSILEGSMTALTWVPSAVAISALFFALTVVALIHHWFPKLLIPRAAALLRTSAIAATVWILLQQMLFSTGLGSELVRGFQVYSDADVSAAWHSISISILSIDMLFGAGQLLAELWAQKRLRSAPV